MILSENINVSECPCEEKKTLTCLSDQYLVSASSSGDKLVVSSLKSTPIPVVELADGVSAQLLILFSRINNVYLSSLQYVHILVACDVKDTMVS